jgi:hypothetical protein
MIRPEKNSPQATEAKLLPSMVRWMAFLHGDENAATCGTEFSAGSQRSFDGCAIISDLDNLRGQKDGIVCGRRPQQFD